MANLSNFWQAYRNNLEVIQLETENLIAARENYEIAMERYLLGDLPGIEMREAQKSLLDAEERIARRSTIPSSAKYRCSRSAETSGSICSDRKRSSFRFEKTTPCLGVVFSSCVSRSLGCVVSESGLTVVTG